MVGATFLSVGNRSAGRLEKWGHEAGRRDNHRPSACSGARTNRIMVAVLTDDRTGDGAHGWRPDFGAARSAWYRLLAPIKVTDSGRSNGTEGRGGEAAQGA